MARTTPPPVGGPPTDGALCVSFVAEFGVSGASISVVSHLGRQATVCATDATAARAEALQFELGEGPHWDALSSRTPVLCSDLDAEGETRWPLFVDAARGLGIRAVFAFPMPMGAAIVGVVDLYSTAPRAADREFVARASSAAGRVAIPSVQRALRSARDHASAESPMAPALRREVHQATGMILSQLGVSATAAFARLQGHALVTGRSIEEIAHMVVLRELAFDDFPDEIPN
jgi:hypothetical protein